MLQIYLIQHFPGNKEKFLTSQQPCKFLSSLPLGCSSTSFFLSSESFTHYPWSLHSLIFYMLPGNISNLKILWPKCLNTIYFLWPPALENWFLTLLHTSVNSYFFIFLFDIFAFHFNPILFTIYILIFLALWKQL